MKKYILLFTLVSFFVTAYAQDSTDVNALHETAKAYMRKGDYDNALDVINHALEVQPSDLSLLKDQAFVYYLQKDYSNSIKCSTILVARPDADIQCFQVLGLAYREIAEYKECEKLYKTGLKKFPTSGVLYNEYGEMLSEDKREAAAINEWEAGIQADPNYNNNYYNASKYYDESGNAIWALLYGETFINIESLSDRTTEIKELLLRNYKKLFSTAALVNSLQKGTPFEKAVAFVFSKNKSITNMVLSPESLAQLGARFMLLWDEKYAAEFPFHLFDSSSPIVAAGYV